MYTCVYTYSACVAELTLTFQDTRVCVCIHIVPLQCLAMANLGSLVQPNVQQLKDCWGFHCTRFKASYLSTQEELPPQDCRDAAALVSR